MPRPLSHPFEDPRLPELYDAFAFADDVPLYAALAADLGGRVLEIACGTGRLVVPIAERGAIVVGVDSSPPMLTRARAKLGGVASEVSDRVTLIAGDMRDFDAGAEFDLALVAVKSFGYMIERRDQQRALANIARHVRPGGLVVFDLLNPTIEWLSMPDGAVRQDLCEQRPNGSTVMRTETAVSTDWAAQVRQMRSVYETVSPDGSAVKTIVEWPLRYTFRHEAELLMERAGLEIADVWGGYDRSPYRADSRALIVAARRL